jgi:hypothetical protein
MQPTNMQEKNKGKKLTDGQMARAKGSRQRVATLNLASGTQKQETTAKSSRHKR